MLLNTNEVVGGLVALSLVFGLSACTKDGDDPAPAAPTASAESVKSRPGIVQVGDDDGPTSTETETCQGFRDAVVRNRQRLTCERPELLPCPQLIRPLASLRCATYSAASLETCVKTFDEASDCEALEPGACILTAVLHQLDPTCAPDGSVTDAWPATADNTADGGYDAHDGSSQTAPPPVDGGPLDGGETSAEPSTSREPTSVDAATDLDASTAMGGSSSASE